jgi:protein SCO1/2
MAAPLSVERPVGAPARRFGPLAQGLVLIVAAVLTLGALLGVTALVARPAATASPTATPTSYLVAPRPAPDLRLTGTDGRPFDLRALRGSGVLVFFGYTHCPDVCPATTGIISQVLDRYGAGLVAAFVSIDPERDTVEWLAGYEKYLPPGFAAATGTPAEVRATADAWGVRYARVDGDGPDSYWMNHTASVYLVDRDGMLRAEFPFGTEPDAMGAAVREILGPPAPTPTDGAAPTDVAAPTPAATPSAKPTTSPTAAPTPGPSAVAEVDLRVQIASSSVWTRGASPVIVALFSGAGRINDVGAQVTLQVADPAGNPRGPRVPATAVRPPGVAEVSYVATLDVPAPGWWRLVATLERDGTEHTAFTSLAALDPGMTAPLGAAAPSVRTPTLDDVGGDATAVTTDPAPDLRLSQTSTVDALAAGKPFVLVLDSTRFRTSPACGQAIIIARFLLDRWPDVPIIHLEPFEYDVVSDTPVLRGTLSDPTLVPAAAAWGIGPTPWAATSMPWVFVVDGDGIVRAKYQGIIGSADIDVILSQIVR